MRIRSVLKHSTMAVLEGALIAPLVVGLMAGTALAGKPAAAAGGGNTTTGGGTTRWRPRRRQQRQRHAELHRRRHVRYLDDDYDDPIREPCVLPERRCPRRPEGLLGGLARHELELRPGLPDVAGRIGCRVHGVARQRATRRG